MGINFCVYLDAGHGGMSPEGIYTTAPGKMYAHDSGEFHQGSFFYEGVWNRQLTSRVASKLDKLGITYIEVSHEYLDLSLEYRVNKANWYHRNFKQGIYISNHANASESHQARGFEVYTSPGLTGADAMAERHWQNVKDILGDRINYRPDTRDGDADREAGFYVLQKTLMPAMLIEHLFFDNAEDARLLIQDEYIEYFAEAQVRTIIQQMAL